MAKRTAKYIQSGYFPFVKLLPNAVTLIAICIGLSAIRFAFEGEFVKATAFVIIAAFMDAVDGRLARFLNSTSEFGAQLDSLADFVNFGVTPGFVIYCWINSYIDIKAFDWALVMFFAMCGAIRLARFNVDLGRKQDNPIIEKYFFKGIPAPCGASMAMLPMVLTYEFGEGFYSDPITVMFYVAAIAVLMASRVPTISIKKIPVRNEYVYVTLLVLGTIIIGLLSKPWFTLAIVGSTYALSIPITIFYFLKLTLNKKQ
ncbi:MAG TPA: phosphatidylcholine/phosphatidylserine synthase [Rickettsiales bacterium]|nr:phosphatidylcholine/phosphatidylserine synthase [Rickettsiales bacterium]